MVIAHETQQQNGRHAETLSTRHYEGALLHSPAVAQDREHNEGCSRAHHSPHLDHDGSPREPIRSIPVLDRISKKCRNAGIRQSPEAPPRRQGDSQEAIAPRPQRQYRRDDGGRPDQRRRPQQEIPPVPVGERAGRKGNHELRNAHDRCYEADRFCVTIAQQVNVCR